MKFFEYVCPEGHISHVMGEAGAPAPAMCVRCEDEYAGEVWAEDPTCRAVHIPVVSVDPAPFEVPMRVGPAAAHEAAA